MGYKLIKPEYRKASEKIMNANYPSKDNTTVTSESCIDSLRKADIIDLWFEPIYKEEKSFKVEDWVYAEKQEESKKNFDDWRPAQYVPVFQVKEIFNNEYLRPVEGSGSGILASLCRLATTEEIQKAKNAELLAECRKRYPVGTKFHPTHVDGKDFCIITNDNFQVNGEYILALTDEGRSHTCDDKEKYGCSLNRNVWHEGKWARIAPSEPQIIINGYTAKFTKDYVTFGCQEYSKDFVLKLHKMLEDNDFEFEYRKEVEQMADWFNSQE